MVEWDAFSQTNSAGRFCGRQCGATHVTSEFVVESTGPRKSGCKIHRSAMTEFGLRSVISALSCSHTVAVRDTGLAQVIIGLLSSVSQNLRGWQIPAGSTADTRDAGRFS